MLSVSILCHCRRQDRRGPSLQRSNWSLVAHLVALEGAKGYRRWPSTPIVYFWCILFRIRKRQSSGRSHLWRTSLAVCVAILQSWQAIQDIVSHSRLELELATPQQVYIWLLPEKPA